MANHLKIISLIIATIIISHGIAMAQGLGILKETAFVKVFETNKFGRHIFINEIEEDSNGCIILGSTDGIVILTSEDTRFIETPSHYGIRNVKVIGNKIFVSGIGDNGYFEFGDNGNEVFHSITEFNDIKIADIENIVDGNGNIYYIGKNNIYVYNNKKIKKISFYNIISSYHCDSIPLLITKELRLYTFDGEQVNEILNLNKLCINPNSYLKMVDLGNDSIALINSDKIFKISKQSILSNSALEASDIATSNMETERLNNAEIRDIKYDHTLRKLAIATNHGIFIFSPNGKHLQTVNYTSGLPIDDVRKLNFDSKHNLWASLNSELVKIELNTSTVYYTERQGINGDIFCFESINGNYYCSTLSDVYTATANNKAGENTMFMKVNFHNTVQNTRCWNLQVFDGHLLAFTNNGLYEIKGNDASKILNIRNTVSIAKSNALPGKVLISGHEGIKIADYDTKNDNISITNVRDVKGLEFPTWQLQANNNGTIWFSSFFDGLFYMVPKDGNLEKYSLVNIGRNSNIQKLSQTKFTISDKYVYVYGEDMQKAELPYKKDFVAHEINFRSSDYFTQYLKNFSKTDITPLNEEGDVFINTENNYIIANRESKTFDTIHFPANIKRVNNVFMRDSLLFLSTDIGLLKHNLKAKPYEKPGEYPFKVMIENIKANDSIIYNGFKYFGNSNINLYSLDTNNGQNLGIKIKSLKIQYTSSCFENAESITYSYKLEGLHDKWSAYSDENSHDFGKLSPGSYTFRVRAKNLYGVVSNEAVYRFTIEEVIYLRWWAIMIYIIIGSILIYIPIKYLVKENRRLNKLAADRYDEIIRQNERLQLLSLVASKNTNSVIILKKDGKFEWRNDSFTNFYGYSAKEYEELFGENYFEIQQKASPYNEQIIKSAIENRERASFESIHIGPNGHRVYAQTHLDPVFEDEQGLKNWIVTETNITKLKLAEKEGMEQAEKLVEAYTDLKKNQDRMEFQTRQLKIINERLEVGYKQIKRQNMTINQSLRYAQGIQNSILPSSDKFAELVHHFIVYWPKAIVSGDFYMIHKLSQDSFITIVADCTGHGVPGAFMSIIGYDILTQIIMLRKITEPSIILEQLSKQLIDMLDLKRIQNTDGIALSICKFTKHENHVDLTFAGSDSHVYIHEKATNTIQKLKGSRRQTGINGEIFNRDPFSQETVQISYNDMVIQFSDGIIDECNNMRRRYGSPRFQKIITDNAQAPVDEMGTIIETDLTKFMQDAEQRDDITVLGFKIKK